MYSRSQEILRYIRDRGPTAAHTIWEHFGMSSYQETDACIIKTCSVSKPTTSNPTAPIPSQSTV